MNERRRYFRITDHLIVNYRLVTPEQRDAQRRMRQAGLIQR